jgi:beta-carotene ketolase (CrtO type)
MTHTYDVIVVGAGVNGLTAGAYLARSGLKVAVVERRNECGAFALTEDLFGGEHPTDTHAAVCFLPMSPVWGDLDLERHGFDLLLGKSGAAAVWPDGKNYVYYYDLSLQARELERLSPKDAAVTLNMRRNLVPDALELLWLFFRPPSEEGAERLFSLGRYVGIEEREFRELTGLELLEQLFEEEHVRLLWLGAADIGLFGDVAAKGEGAVAVMLSSLLATGTPRGGMHTLTHALVRCFRAYGGTLLLNAPVEHVRLSGEGQSEGHSVILAEQAPYPVKELTARHAVIFNVAPLVACGMLDRDQLARRDPDLLAKMESWQSEGHCAFISHFLIHGLPEWGSRAWNPDVDISPFVLRPYNSWTHAKESQERYHRGATMEVLGDIAEIYNQTGLDRSRMSPDGTCTLSVEIEYPVALEAYGGFAAWDNKELTDRVHWAHADMMERLAPGFRSQIVDSCYFTPLDNWRRNASAIYGHEIGGDNSGPQWYLGRVPPRSAIPGVYFSQGIWPASLTHLGNGYVAACVVAEDLGVRDQEWWRSAPMERFLERYVAHVRDG